MKFVETSRNIEPHSECLINVYVQDERGAPVSNVKFKIWAGPPPDGQPPYFQDDDPNNPDRTTDANGRFQFVVANPAPKDTLDFFAQPLENGSAVGSPIHLNFPAGVAQWATVTLAPEGAGGPGGQIPVLPKLDLDPRLSEQVRVDVEFVQPAANAPYWKLISARYLDPDESGGNVNIVCYVQDEYGRPLPGARVAQRWPGDEASALSDERGHIEFPMSGDSSFDPARQEHGPYSVLVSGGPSDSVVGMGLPLKRHVGYVLTWRKAIPEAAAEPPARSIITGRITNADPGAVVRLEGTNISRSATMAPDGTFAFADLPPGQYSLKLDGVGVINSKVEVDGRQSVSVEYQVPPRSAKPFEHYLLFGPGNLPATMTNLILALDYIVRYGPIVGFRPSEAQNATHVTIVGDTSGVSQSDEQSLRNAGCVVTRLTAPDSYALETLFKQLVTGGSPYPR